MFKKKKKFSDVSLICNNSKQFTQLDETFNILNELNKILANCISENLVNLCRVGAINQKDNNVVIYVTEQEILHLIKVHCDHILYNFSNHGYYFDGILIKVKLNSEFIHLQQSIPNIKFKNFNNKSLEKLSKLANAINSPDLINETYTNSDKSCTIDNKGSTYTTESNVVKDKETIKHDFNYFLEK